MKKRENIKNNLVLKLFLLIALLIGVNLLFSQVRQRLDLTQDKRYTLSAPTKKTLRNLKEEVHITVFLKNKNMPSEFRYFASETENLLEDFRRTSGGLVHFDFINPLADVPDSLHSKAMDSLAALGILPYNVRANKGSSEGVSMQMLFPGAIVDYQGKRMGMNLLEPRPGLDPNQSIAHSIALLEFNFIHAISKLVRDGIPKVGYLLGHGETLDPTVFDLLTTVDQNYRFDTLNLKNIQFIPPDMEALILMDPITPFSDADKLKLDQYVMHGGNILWAVHPIGATMDSLKRSSSFLAYDRGINLEDLFFTYGFRINSNILQGLHSFSIPMTVGSMGNRPQIEQIPWLYAPLLQPSSTSPITQNLESVLSFFPGSIDTTKSTSIEKEVLLHTSNQSRSQPTPVRISLEEAKEEPPFSTFGNKSYMAAVLLKGTFPSAFAHRISQEDRNQIEQSPYGSFLEKSRPSKMIVVSDPNIFKNEVSEREGPLSMGTDSYTRQHFDNKAFLENSLTYLTDTTHILQARNKDVSIGLLDPAKLKKERSKWLVLNFLFPIVLIGLIGVGFAGIRKRRYTRD